MKIRAIFTVELPDLPIAIDLEQIAAVIVPECDKIAKALEASYPGAEVKYDYQAEGKYPIPGRL